MIDETTGELLDDDLAGHGYQLWTAGVGTLIEAQRRGAKTAVLVVHQFRPTGLGPATLAGDDRAWKSALRSNDAAIAAFTGALKETGGKSHATDFAEAETRLHVVKVECVITL